MTLPDNCVGIMEYCFIKYNKTEKLYPGDYIVLIEFKYDYEKEFNYEMNILSVDDDITFLLNDTDEGQEHFEILAYCPLDVDPGLLKYFAKDVKENLK